MAKQTQRETVTTTKVKKVPAKVIERGRRVKDAGDLLRAAQKRGTFHSAPPKKRRTEQVQVFG